MTYFLDIAAKDNDLKSFKESIEELKQDFVEETGKDISEFTLQYIFGEEDADGQIDDSFIIVAADKGNIEILAYLFDEFKNDMEEYLEVIFCSAFEYYNKSNAINLFIFGCYIAEQYDIVINKSYLDKLFLYSQYSTEYNNALEAQELNPVNEGKKISCLTFDENENILKINNSDIKNEFTDLLKKYSLTQLKASLDTEKITEENYDSPIRKRSSEMQENDKKDSREKYTKHSDNSNSAEKEKQLSFEELLQQLKNNYNHFKPEQYEELSQFILSTNNGNSLEQSEIEILGNTETVSEQDNESIFE